MKTDSEKKSNNPNFKFSRRNRIIAGILAALMLISVVIIDPSPHPFARNTAQTEQAPPEETATDEQDGAQTEVNLYAYWLQKAGDAVGAEDYDNALSYLEQCEALAPDDEQLTMVLLQKGNILFDQEKYSDAQECFSRCLDLNQETYPPSAIYCYSAKCSLLLDDPQGAVSECGLGISLVQDADENEAELYMLRGTAFVYMGEYALASGDYSTAIEKGYSDTETLYEQISLCSYLSGDYNQTIQAGEQTTSGDNNIWKSMSYYSLGAYDKAAQAYEALLGTDQTYFTAAQLYSSIAKCRVLLGQYDKAITQCTAGLQTNDAGEAATLYALRGTAYMAVGGYADAVSDYLSAVNSGYVDPASLYTQCSACSYYLGECEAAVQYGITAQNGNAEDTEAVLWTALSYYELGDYVNAQPWLERSLNITQSYCSQAELYRCLARCQLTENNYEEAAAQATMGIVNSGGDATGDMYAIRGAAYQSMGEYSKALKDFYAAIALGYSDPYEMYRQCTLCNFLLDDYVQAVSCGERALENTSEADAALYYWLGISYFSLGDYNKGKQTLLKAAELDDNQENLYFYLGICCFSLGDYGTAVEYFTTSSDRGETAVRSTYNRALCYLQLERYTEAKKDLEAVAAQQEDTEIAQDATDLLKSLSTIFY